MGNRIENRWVAKNFGNWSKILDAADLSIPSGPGIAIQPRLEHLDEAVLRSEIQVLAVVLVREVLDARHAPAGGLWLRQ